ncbi:unnamed protein product, partial [Ectocarpus sp. 4 AP-2014]
SFFVVRRRSGLPVSSFVHHAAGTNGLPGVVRGFEAGRGARVLRPQGGAPAGGNDIVPREIGDIRLRGQQGLAQALPILSGPVPAGEGCSRSREGADECAEHGLHGLDVHRAAEPAPVRACALAKEGGGLVGDGQICRLLADLRGRGHASLDRERTRVQEAHPCVHRPHPGHNLPGLDATEHRAVPRLGWRRASVVCGGERGRRIGDAGRIKVQICSERVQPGSAQEVQGIGGVRQDSQDHRQALQLLNDDPVGRCCISP